MNMKTVAVVGGTGFLGRHVVHALQESGFSVRVLSRRTGFDAHQPDPESLKSVDAVVNLAGIKRENGAQTFEAVHVDLVRALVDTMRQTGIRRLVHISVVVARRLPIFLTTTPSGRAKSSSARAAWTGRSSVPA